MLQKESLFVRAIPHFHDEGVSLVPKCINYNLFKGKNLEIIQLNSFTTQIKWAINDDQGIPIFHVLLNNKWKKFQIDPQQGKLLK